MVSRSTPEGNHTKMQGRCDPTALMTNQARALFASFTVSAREGEIMKTISAIVQNELPTNRKAKIIFESPGSVTAVSERLNEPCERTPRLSKTNSISCVYLPIHGNEIVCNLAQVGYLLIQSSFTQITTRYAARGQGTMTELPGT